MRTFRASITVLFAFILSVRATKVLILGGNGFMGGETVDLLLKELPDYKLTTLNRGSWYWREGDDRRVRQINCDRYKDGSLQDSCPKLHHALLTERFDYVVDFSCYDGTAMENLLVAMPDFDGVYVYISSDSVYEVCERAHTKPSTETDAPCPYPDPEFERHLKRSDSYGHGKLQAELILTASKIDHVILRLPDVIGPKDSLHRLWRYLIWMQVSKSMNKPVPLPQFFLNRQLSLVYVKDVAKLILQILTKDEKDILNQAYNLAFDETVSLYRLLEMSRRHLTKNEVKYQVDATSGFYLYPSVNVGPVNTTKAKTILNWQPTPLEEAVKTTVQFFEGVMRDRSKNRVYEWNRERVISRLVQGAFHELGDQLEFAIEDIYDSKPLKDEL